jgi:hypothetical protein
MKWTSRPQGKSVGGLSLKPENLVGSPLADAVAHQASRSCTSILIMRLLANDGFVQVLKDELGTAALEANVTVARPSFLEPKLPE